MRPLWQLKAPPTGCKNACLPQRCEEARAWFSDAANERNIGPENRFRRRWRRHLPRDCAIARVSCKKAGENVSCRLRMDKVFVYFMRLQMRVLRSGVF